MMSNFQDVASTTSEIIVRNELEKYIADLEVAINELDCKRIGLIRLFIAEIS